MTDPRRVILFSTDSEGNRGTIEELRSDGFQITVVSEPSLLMRELRNGRDRVVLLDLEGNGSDRVQLLREIKRLDGSIQTIAINAEPRLFLGIQIFRAGGEACFFKSAPLGKELCEALHSAFDKVARWWRSLQAVAAIRASVEAEPSRGGNSAIAATNEGWDEVRYLGPNEDIEVVTRAAHLKGKAGSSSSAGMELLISCTDPPAPFESVLVRHRGRSHRGVVRRLSKHTSGGWLIGLEWIGPSGGASVPVGARADRALFVTLEGHHVVARSLVAVNRDWVSARLATGRVHSVPTNAVCALTRFEREAELLATDDLSFFVELYQLQSITSLSAIAQAVMEVEFPAGEGAP